MMRSQIQVNGWILVCTLLAMGSGCGGSGETEAPPSDPEQPSVTQPSVTQPPVTQPPVTQPPVTQPPSGVRQCPDKDTAGGLLRCALALYEDLRKFTLPEIVTLIDEGEKTLIDNQDAILHPPQDSFALAVLCSRLAITRSQVARINLQIRNATGTPDATGLELGVLISALGAKIGCL